MLPSSLLYSMRRLVDPMFLLVLDGVEENGITFKLFRNRDGLVKHLTRTYPNFTRQAEKFLGAEVWKSKSEDGVIGVVRLNVRD